MKAEEMSLGLAPHETIIEPNQSWLRVNWAQLWEYRDLLALLVHREFASKYKQTVLGPVWFILQPLLTSLVYTVFMGHVVKLSTNGIPLVLFFLGNQLAWNYLQQNLSTGGAIFTNNAALFGKVYFPRLVVPLSIVFSNLFACVLQLITFFIIYAGYVLIVPATGGIHVTPMVLCIPLLYLDAAALSLGVCLWLSSLTAKYRDLSQVLQLIVQLWMFASPVLYPLADVPLKWRWVMELNPMTAILESFRYCLLGVGTLTPESVTVSIAATLLLLLTGILVFQRTERTFIDTV
ncbi:MAG TPA: ABC transporter permease [Chthoniobacteraceae bacterium]|jgi:lipopolysaccharide transport system permease protein|nr:ABC transporter permease [Chthoniobacteraceae bacterium]